MGITSTEGIYLQLPLEGPSVLFSNEHHKVDPTLQQLPTKPC